MLICHLNAFLRIWLISCFTLVSMSAMAELSTTFFKGDNIKLEEFDMGYFVDKTGEMPFKKIQQQTFQPSKNAMSLGIDAKTTWTKIELENTTLHAINLYVHYPYAYRAHKIELYEVSDGRLINTYKLDMDNKDTHSRLYGGSAVFDISLDAEQHTTLYAKHAVYTYQWFSINIYDLAESKRALLNQHFEIVFCVGILLTLAFYNLMLFFSSRKIEYLFYAGYLIINSFWISFAYGLLANLFNLYGESTLRLHFSLALMPTFLMLFIIRIFDIQKKHPIEFFALIIVLSIVFLNGLYSFIDTVAAISFGRHISLIWLIVTFLVSISMLIRKHPIAPLFALGHGIYIILGGISTLFYKGDFEFSYLSSHGVGIGILIESLVLSIIIFYRIRILEKIKLDQVRLNVLATTDPLTKLFNRRKFNTEVNKHLSESSSATSCITIIDIDHFKKINDAYGHNAGDQALISISNALRNLFRQQDIVARHGGEEFIVFMPNTTLKEAFIIVEGVRCNIEELNLEIDPENEIFCTISAGTSEINSQSPDINQTIHYADLALYKAKHNGRNQSQIHEIDLYSQ